MPLMFAGLLGAWFLAPLVAMADPVFGWITLGTSLAAVAIGGVAELYS